VFRGDSELVIKQIKGESKVERSSIVFLYKNTMPLISKFKHIQFELISSEENNEANRLCNKVYEDLAARHPRLRDKDTFMAVDDETTIENCYSSS